MNKADAIRSVYTDPESVIRLTAEDFRIHSAGNNPIAGVTTGLPANKARFDRMDEMTGGTFRHDLVGLCVVNDTWGMSVVQLFGERNGKSMDMTGFGLWQFDGDKITDHWECPSDQKAWDEFWS